MSKDLSLVGITACGVTFSKSDKFGEWPYLIRHMRRVEARAAAKQACRVESLCGSLCPAALTEYEIVSYSEHSRGSTVVTGRSCQSKVLTRRILHCRMQDLRLRLMHETRYFTFGSKMLSMRRREISRPGCSFFIYFSSSYAFPDSLYLSQSCGVYL